MQHDEIYKDLARYYDLIYSWKDYRTEAEKIRKLIKRYQRSGGKDLLEVACGTGAHARYLKKHFKVTATDLNQGMLRVAKAKVKGVRFLQADMTRLRLGKKFDAIVCLFSSIGYLKATAEIKRAFDGFAKHLKPGGVVIIEPWLNKSGYRVNTPHLNSYNGEDIKIARAVVSKKRGDISVMDMHYLIAERGQTVKHFIDRHELLLTEPSELVKLLKDAGLKAAFIKNGLMKDRGLLVGVKESRP